MGTLYIDFLCGYNYNYFICDAENGMADMVNYELIRSKRKTIGIQVTSEGKVIVRAPHYATKKQIENCLKEHEEHILEIAERAKSINETTPKLTEEELRALADKALEVIPQKAKYYAQLAGVQYHGITIRNQRTRWGSCSAKKNLNFNCLLMLTPPEVLDYVVVHEICHLKEMNHSAAFWAEVEKLMPDYREPKKWLKEHGDEIMARNII